MLKCALGRIGLALLFGVGAVQAAPVADDSFLLHHEIPLVRTAHFREFEAMASQTRAEFRARMMNELTSAGSRFIRAKGNMAEILAVLGEFQLRYHRLYESSLARADVGVARAVADQIVAGYYLAAQADGLSSRDLRARFAGAGFRGQPADGYVYGSYATSVRGELILTVQYFRMSTGEFASESITGRAELVGERVGRALFALVNRKTRFEWSNPLPKITWVVAIPTAEFRSAAEAKLYCQGQGARIPYADELVLAAQGGEYRNGGIPRLRNQTAYPVADQYRVMDQYYYYATGSNADPIISNGTHGRPAQIGAVCARGEPDPKLVLKDELYRMIRALRRESRDSTVTPKMRAIETLIAELSGAPPPFADDFETTAEALGFLERQGVSITFPTR